jgi:protein gp37
MATKIEWADETWNVTAGCTQVSEGCRHCYAQAMSARLGAMGHEQYKGVTVRRPTGVIFNGVVRPVLKSLDKPFGWRKPRRVFVNSMSDLFHPMVPVSFLRKVFDVMCQVRRHQYIVLTKRPARAVKLWDDLVKGSDDMSHVVFGCTMENVKAVRDQAVAFLAVPSKFKLISAEPLLGPIVFPSFILRLGRNLEIIAGGESGPRARVMDPAWARSIRDECKTWKANFCFKQWGRYAPASVPDLPRGDTDPATMPGWVRSPSSGTWMRLQRKSHAGRLLDGELWDERVDDRRESGSDVENQAQETQAAGEPQARPGVQAGRERNGV